MKHGIQSQKVVAEVIKLETIHFKSVSALKPLND